MDSLTKNGDYNYDRRKTISGKIFSFATYFSCQMQSSSNYCLGNLTDLNHIVELSTTFFSDEQSDR